MNILSEKLNTLSKNKTHRLTPNDWVDDYSEEFFNETLLLTKDAELSQTILESTFYKGISNISEFAGNEDEHTWLVRILYDEIKKKSQTLFQKSDFSLFYQKCLEGVSYLEKEAFRLKTLKNEKTKDICKKLQINEDQFWKYLHNMRVSLSH